MQVMKDSWLTNLYSWYVFVEEHVDRELPEMREYGELRRTSEEIYAFCFKNSSVFLRKREGLKPRNSLEMSVLEPGSSLLQINIFIFWFNPLRNSAQFLTHVFVTAAYIFPWIWQRWSDLVYCFLCFWLLVMIRIQWITSKKVLGMSNIFCWLKSGQK